MFLYFIYFNMMFYVILLFSGTFGGLYMFKNKQSSSIIFSSYSKGPVDAEPQQFGLKDVAL